MNKILKNLSYHAIDSTAIVTLLNPVMAGLETKIACMSNEVSINARILGITLTFLGLGSLYSKGRDFSRKIFRVTKEVNEKAKQLHDIAYTLIYSAVTTPVFYYAAGSRDVKEIALGTALTIGVGGLIGSPMGYAIDCYRDLTGLEESERLPDSIKNKRPSIKKGLAALLTAGSAGVVSVIYYMNR